MRVSLNNALARRISQLKMNSALSVMSGDFKQARAAQKELAKIAVDYFELTMNVPSPVRGSFSLFSKEGFNALRFIISEKFREKTPEEKRMMQMIELYKKGNLRL